MILDFCAVCGCKDELHHHHIIPRSQGGSSDETNLITLCYTHHAWIHGMKPTTWNNHSKLIKEGIERAVARGSVLGRKPIPKEKIDQMLDMREKGMTQRTIAKRLDVSVGVVCKYLNSGG